MTPHELSYAVYMHVNKMNGMRYIGCTGIKPEKRWGYGSGYRNGQEKFYNAIKEFGWNNFEHVIVQTNMSQKDAWILEENLIKQYDSVTNGYNSAYGGERNNLSEQSKQKLREQRIGEKNPNYKPNKNNTKKHEKIGLDGRKTVEFRLKQKELKTGKNNPNYRKHTWTYGKKMSEEYKQKLKDNYTDERKEKLRLSHLGAKNPQAKRVLCLETGEVFDTIIEASKATGVSERTISDCCNGRTKNPRISFSFYKEGDK